MGRITACMVVVGAVLAVASAAAARVLRVGSYHGIQGQYSSIQAAVDAAKPGDWILIGPGDYKTRAGRRVPGRPDLTAGILITKPGLYIRGMNRNTVIVDGTKAGGACSRSGADQNLGPKGSHGALGLNGILVWKAANVWVQNLTACNFLSGKGDAGNEIWWNGGDRSGKIGGHGYYGSYLTATNTFYKNNGTAAQYGIFSSNWSGGTWSETYASNFSDSGYYIGACQQQCDQTVDRAHGEFNSLGYSGTNSGGMLVVKNSEFDQNLDGFDTDSENGDAPSPQTGACPNGGVSPITHTNSCWVFMDNYVHDNNNSNVPEVGQAGSAPVGTGISISGGRNDTVMHNRFVHNNAWAVLIQVQQGEGGPPCIGGVLNFSFLGVNLACLFDNWGNAILDNSFADNGSFGHATNGDIASYNLLSGNPTNCFSGNSNPRGLTTSPAGLEQTYPACTGAAAPANSNVPLIEEILCGNVGSLVGVSISCPGGVPYPKRTHVVMHALPANLATMPNPCRGVPTNPWCRASAAASQPPRSSSGFTG
ncbi:MAG: hypothetical protein JO244_11670 [Solirubrobacterales bacterium]|nr:hypothetical protein [Solirubrobacterales bacterium]